MRWLRKHKPRVFLAAISVYPRNDLKRHIEQPDLGESEALDESLRRTLTEIFSLPPAASVDDPSSTDLALDVWIPKFHAGQMVDVDLFDAGITLMWRPKVTVASHLHFMTTGKTKATFKVTEKMKWRYTGSSCKQSLSHWKRSIWVAAF